MAARGRTTIAAMAAAAVLAATLTLGAPTARAADPWPAPGTMAGLGDSISRGFNACGWYFDCVARSWSTGDSAKVDGHYRRLQTANPAIAGNRHNNAATGADSASLADQATVAVEQKAEYVTILIGADDACADTEPQMTTVDAYRSNVAAALAVLKSGLPDSHVFIASIPDLYRLWVLGKDRDEARGSWRDAGVCQTMLADPQSTTQDAFDRRLRVRQRVIDYNDALRELCASYGGNCRYDGGAVFATPFTASDISQWDYFHPNAAGQRKLAGVTYPIAFG